jgi:hypothetical protein
MARDLFVFPRRENKHPATRTATVEGVVAELVAIFI